MAARPYNITINNGGTTTAGATPLPNYESAATSTIDRDDIETQLDVGTSVTIQTGGGSGGYGDITVAADIAKSAGGDTTLTLKAHRDILFNSAVDITSSTGTLDVVLNTHYGSDVAEGRIYFAGNNSISTNGGDITMGGGTNPLTIPAIGHAISGLTYDKRGIYLSANSTLDAAGGNINMAGIGLGGIWLKNDITVTTSGTGSIYLTGDDPTSLDNGILLEENTIISATGSGNVVLNAQDELWTNADGGSLSISSASGDVTVIADSLDLSNTLPTFSAANGTVTFKPATTSKTIDVGGAGGDLNIPTALFSSVSTLQIGDTGQSGAITISGDPSLSGKTFTLATSGSITQTAAITAGGLELLGGGTYTLTNTGNNIATLAGNTAALSYVDSDTFTIGTAGGTSGLTSSGTVDIATFTGDLTLTENIIGTSIRLNAGKNTAPGTATGGNILISGSPTVTATTGSAILYSGSVPDSSGLTSLIGSGSGNFRYNSDESTTNYAAPLGATGNYAVYREQPTATITPDNQTMAYGDAVPTITSSTAVVNGDTEVQIFSTLYSVSIGGAQSPSGNYIAGAHALTPSGAVDRLGYSIGYTPGALTINPALLTVTAEADSKSYDGLAYNGGNGVTYNGFVSGETSDVLGGSLTYGSTSQGAVNAGSYVITPSGYTPGNYSFNYNSGTLTVNKATLTVIAVADSKTYDGLAYSGGNGVSYTGFVNGETNAVLGGSLAYSGTSQGAVSAGSYAITPSGWTAGNYTLSFVDGDLTVNPALPTTTDIDSSLSTTVTGVTLTTSTGSGSGCCTRVTRVPRNLLSDR